MNIFLSAFNSTQGKLKRRSTSFGMKRLLKHASVCVINSGANGATRS